MFAILIDDGFIGESYIVETYDGKVIAEDKDIDNVLEKAVHNGATEITSVSTGEVYYAV